jgi:hypothetical protein
MTRPAPPVLRRIPWAAVGLAAAVLALHLGFRATAPAPRFWGDEEIYVAFAQADARAGTTSLLPGTLGFDHRPIFGARVLARFVPGLFQRSTLLNSVLMALVVLLTYAQGRVLGLGPGAALAAAGLLGTFPWLGFHVHSLWPEVLHAFFFALLLLAQLLYLRRLALAWLPLAGVAMAYALFTKGALNAFVPLFAAHLALATWRGLRAAPSARRLARAGLAAAVYGGTVLLVILPQLARNARAGQGWSLAANRWWNLELGLATDDSIDDVNQRYWASAPDPAERERLARERTLAHVRAVGVPAQLRSQLSKLEKLLVRKPSEFEASLHREGRWGEPPPAWIAALEAPARAQWYAILLLGTAGLALAGRRSPGWTHLALFALAFGAALFLVPVKPRFALPLVPVLCLFAGAALERLVERLRLRRASGRAV